MGKVPKPNIVWRGAHPNNFTVGRPGGGLDGRNTFHHVVGTAESAVLVFNNPSRGASSHLVITDRPDVAAFQCVDFSNTAWCDGNWDSNLRTISMEHHGDWRFGYNNPQVLENSAQVVAWLRDQGLVSRYVRHRDVSRTATVCPGDLPVEAIWNRATEIINSYNTPVDTRPQWLKDRVAIGEKVMYGQNDGLFLRNLNDPSQAVDARRFPRNQDFRIGGYTIVGGKKYWITVSSMGTNAPNGLLDGEVMDERYVPPTPPPVIPPVPVVPDWASSLLVDENNRPMYVIRATPLIDLEHGRPFLDKNGKEKWFQAGEKIDDISASTTVGGVTYQMTEYSFKKTKEGDWAGFGNGIASRDLSVDPAATPPGTPNNPDLDAETVGLLKSIVTKLGEIIKSITDFLLRRGK